MDRSTACNRMNARGRSVASAKPSPNNGRHAVIGTRGVLPSRTFPLCESLNFREWSGYYALSVVNAASRRRIQTQSSARLVLRAHRRLAASSTHRSYPVFSCFAHAVNSWIASSTRDAYKLAVGQVYYTAVVVYEHGHVNSTIDGHRVWTTASSVGEPRIPSLRWLTQNAIDSTCTSTTLRRVAAPHSRPSSADVARLLKKNSCGADAAL